MTDAAFASAAHVVELDIVNNKISAALMEPRSGIAEYDAARDTYKLPVSARFTVFVGL